MRALKRTQTSGIAALCLIAFCGSARADGLDLDYFVRFNTMDHSWAYVWTMVAIIMVVNYSMNFVVIGLPAIVRARADASTVALGLVFLTVLGQIADRIGSILGLFLAMPLAGVISAFISPSRDGLNSPAFVYAIFSSNLLCSGIAVGGLAQWFLRKRWSVPKSLSWKIALAAAVLTNPAWILLLRIVRP
jgi:hypothetical protein